ncbi:MAG: tRNA lysidine(34) synthetase TilS [Prevotellaceae bacterium]|nr:tRNA lysidine(34) synthetase TilS [Prevotellaceae bacterium]
MLRQLKSYIAHNKLLCHADALLVTVSGGVDSMTLLHLLRAAGYRVAVAHCNFRLRGSESDGDEQLVRSCCSQQNIPIFVAHFDTREYAKKNAISIQMAARELRYAWFESVAAEHGFDKIAVAHNANDNVETFFLNLARSTGLRGLSGMAAAQGRIVRPLLFASRPEILRYAQEHSILFREDSSNSQVKYARNRIRHNILTELAALNPSILPTIQGCMERIRATQCLVAGIVDDLQKRACFRQENRLYIKISELPAEQPEFWLFELLHEYGFSGATAGDVAAALNGSPGKVFYSSTHRLLKDRELLIVAPKEEPNGDNDGDTVEAAEKALEVESRKPKVAGDATVTLTEEGLNGLKVKAGGRIFSFEVVSASGIRLNQGGCVAMLDYDALQFPLRLRRWQAGDRFVPLGMKGEKKLSDFLTDSKLSLFEKQEQLLLCSANGNVAWVAGRRIGNRYRVTESTRRILKVTLHPTFPAA